MSTNGVDTSAPEAGVFRGTPLKESTSVSWPEPLLGHGKVNHEASSQRFASSRFAEPPLAFTVAGTLPVHDAGIPRLKPPSAVMRHDMTNDLARLAAAERALRHLQHENDRLKSGEVANHHEQAALRHLVATLQAELQAMEGVVQDQLVTLKAVSSEVTRLDPYHLVKSRRPTNGDSSVAAEPSASVHALKETVTTLEREKQTAIDRQKELEAANAHLEAEVARLSTSLAPNDSAPCLQSPLTTEQERCLATHDELFKGFCALDAFACQWCSRQRAVDEVHSAVRVPGQPTDSHANLLHVQLRVLSCVDATPLVDEWRDQLPSATSAPPAGFTYPHCLRISIKDTLQRPLLSVVASPSDDADTSCFDVVDDAGAVNETEFTCLASSKWSVTVDVEALGSAEQAPVLVATAALPVSALVATGTRRRGRAREHLTARGATPSLSHTMCVPLQLTRAAHTHIDAQPAPLSIERECGTLCMEVTVTHFTDLWDRPLVGPTNRSATVGTARSEPSGGVPETDSRQFSPAVVPVVAMPSLPNLSNHADGAISLINPGTNEAAVPAPDCHSQTDGGTMADTPWPVCVPPPPPPPLVPVPDTGAVADGGRAVEGATWLPSPPPPVQVPIPTPDVSSECVTAAPLDAGTTLSADATHDTPAIGDGDVAVYIQSASGLLECVPPDGETPTPCRPRVQMWLGEVLVFTTPVSQQGCSPTWSPEDGRVTVPLSPTAMIRFDIQDVQSTEVDFIGSASLWASDVLDDCPCERVLPVLLSGKRHGSVTVGFTRS